jgi:SAM-dependent methyltransferase
MRRFRDRKLAGESFEDLFEWAATGHSQADVEAIWDEIVLKIPTGASVLELGCGEGGFAAKLRAHDNTVTYRGVDIVPEIVTAAQAAVPAETFEVCPMWDALMEETPAWDYVVSIHTAFSYDELRYCSLLFDLINAKAAKGFFLLVAPNKVPHDLHKWDRTTDQMVQGTQVDAKVTAFVAASTNVTDSYDGVAARNFLEEPLIKGMVPIFINRDSVTAEVPEVPSKLCIKANGRFNLDFAFREQKLRKKQGLEPVSDTPGFDANGNWVTNIQFPNMVD